MDHENNTCSVRFLRIDRANCIADNRWFVESRIAATCITQTAVCRRRLILATADTREQKLAHQNLVKEKANKRERRSWVPKASKASKVKCFNKLPNGTKVTNKYWIFFVHKRSFKIPLFHGDGLTARLSDFYAYILPVAIIFLWFP